MPNVQLPYRKKTMTTDWIKVLEYLEPKKPEFCPEEASITQKVFLRTNGIEALFGGAAGGDSSRGVNGTDSYFSVYQAMGGGGGPADGGWSW